MIVGILQLDMHLPARRSLKEKRQALRRIKDRVTAAFRLPMVEVDHQDVWQRTMLGCAAVSGEDGDVHSLLEKVVQFVDGMGVGTVLRHDVEILRR
ncbi:MAG: DUF503 domain-containing protein [Deltaproteobacteria bacterium]|nr:DUF503 domain-containing protein [Deltaproteobacteria bacterium]